jgi:hypothetical protein
MVELHRLLLIERVDVGVAAFDDIGLVSGRSVAKGAGAESALRNDRVTQNANPVDLDLDDVARFHP